VECTTSLNEDVVKKAIDQLSGIGFQFDEVSDLKQVLKKKLKQQAKQKKSEWENYEDFPNDDEEDFY
jgi:hypothetical protein